MTSRSVGLIATIVFGVALACLLALQSLSLFLERREPALSTTLNPLNGHAREQLAFREFTARVQGGDEEAGREPAGDDLSQAATGVQAIALEAFRAEPLTPKALALAALASDSAETRAAILSSASRLNRRDPALQGLVLDQALSNGDYPGVVATLDEMLRVEPGFSQQLFAPLRQALLAPGTARAFVDLLDGSSPWHEAFLLEAVKDSELHVALANIRASLVIENESFDRRLIAGLAGEGQLELARAVYRTAVAQLPSARSSEGSLSWRAQYPPFDWQMVSRRDIRAQPSLDGGELEIYVRPGQGGVVADRTIGRAGGQRSVDVEVASSRPIIAGRLKVGVSCRSGEGASVEQDLDRGSNTLTLPEGCADIRLQIYARAFRNEPVLEARLGQLQFQ